MLEKTNLMNMCMICDGEKVVVIDRKKPNWPGVTFPGGHVEKDESLADSVIREVKEETGLNTPLYVYVFITRTPLLRTQPDRCFRLLR